MARPKTLNPRHAAIKNYYKTLDGLRSQNVENESALRPAFQNLLAESARLRGWTLIPELSTESRGRTVIPDGTVRDANYLPRGYWEAKDSADDLQAEIAKKIQRGYPTSNIIFEDTQRAILYQDKREVLRADLTNPVQLVDLVNQFHNHVEPAIETFEKAIEEFKDRVPGLGATEARRGRLPGFGRSVECDPFIVTSYFTLSVRVRFAKTLRLFDQRLQGLQTNEPARVW